MWWKTRRRLLRLEKQNSRFAELLGQINARLSGVGQQAGPDLGPLITSMLESQGKQFTSASDFLRTINDIAVERAGSALGRRAGRARAASAKRDVKGRMLPNRAALGCPLCDDPMTANFSMAEWNSHQTHKGGRGKTRDYETTGNPVREPDYVDDRGTIDRTQPAYPLPLVTIPPGDEASGAGAGTTALANGDVEHGDHIHKADGTVVRKADVSERN